MVMITVSAVQASRDFITPSFSPSASFRRRYYFAKRTSSGGAEANQPARVSLS